MKRLIVAALAALSLTACDVDNVVKRDAEYRMYKVTEIKRPKHMYVTLKDMKTGSEHRAYVKKRCNRWMEVELYSETALMTEWTTYESGRTTRHIQAGPICPH